MAIVYVAKSKALQEWGADVGISKNLYKVGLTDDITAMAKLLVDDAAHGQADWKIIGKRDVPEITDEEEMLTKLAQRIKIVDPNYYPKMKGARCIFKLNPHDVETHMVFNQTMAGEQPKVKKATPADIGNYFIENVVRN